MKMKYRMQVCRSLHNDARISRPIGCQAAKFCPGVGVFSQERSRAVLQDSLQLLCDVQLLCEVCVLDKR